MNIRSAAGPITAAPIQPSISIGRLEVKAPITDFGEASRMIATIRGHGYHPVDHGTPEQGLCAP